MVTITFNEWCQRPKNQKGFWRRTRASSGDYVAVSLGETPRKIFSQILHKLKVYHDQDIGYGNLLEGVRIDGNNQVVLVPNPNREPLAFIRQDFLDFERLVTRVEDRIKRVKGVKPAYSSRKFHHLCRLLRYKHYKTPDELRRFGFYMRNSPLFLDDTAKFLFFRKVLTLKEFNVGYFHTNVELLSLKRWSDGVRNEDLLAVKNYNGGNPTSQGGNPTNQSKYKYPDESIVFFRNCLGHLREKNVEARFHDADILRVLEDDLPKVIPVWFYELVRQLDLNKQKCWEMCGSGWMEFLSKQLSVFT